ncbi:MAG TPA: ferric reductase-like transmembrane domain-containing protein [Actinomycetes bacterium]|jgi:DMSO/TMAO reductase YedYZ heme-binding membrane subunit|nr:ferric reductase-like transmembrane domain-containing protein [Actinomycetes bacterium]
MNPHLWWYVARSAGLVAYGPAGDLDRLGLAVSTRLLGRWPAAGWTLDLHRFLGGLALTFTGIHLAGLQLDNYVRFDALDLLVPLSSPWRPVAVAWGIVGLYLLLAVEVTSLARRRLPHRLWRRIHLGSFPLLVVTTVHLLAAGTDRTARPVAGILAVTVAATTFLVLFRLLLPPRSRAGGPRVSRS